MAVGQSIGINLIYGYPGGYAIQPDQLTGTAANVSDKAIVFGDLCLYDDTKDGVKAPDATFTMEKVAGVAARTVKQADNYNDQNTVGYNPNEAVTVFKRGIISIVCQDNGAKFNGKVYYRFEAEDNKPKGFYSAAESGKTVELTGYNFSGTADERGVVAIVIKEKINA